MEEADVLSDRIGIVTKGTLRCVVYYLEIGPFIKIKKFIWMWILSVYKLQ